MQEAVQADRLPKAVAGRVKPRGAERPPSDPDGGARALLRAAAVEVLLLGRRLRRMWRRRAVAEVRVQQRRAELVRVPAARQLRVAASGEPRAEAGDLADAGAADGAGAGAGADEAAGDARRGRAGRGARAGVPGVAVEGVRADKHVRRAGGGGEEEEEEELEELAGVGGEEEPEAAEGVLRIRLKLIGINTDMIADNSGWLGKMHACVFQFITHRIGGR